MMPLEIVMTWPSVPIQVDGSVVGAAVRQERGVRFMAIDWRVAEVGYSAVTTVSSDTVGGTANIPSANVVSLSTGFVFHFR